MAGLSLLKRLLDAWQERSRRKRERLISQQWAQLRGLERRKREIEDLIPTMDPEDYSNRRDLNKELGETNFLIKDLRRLLHIQPEEEQEIAEFQAKCPGNVMPGWLLKRNGLTVY